MKRPVLWVAEVLRQPAIESDATVQGWSIDSRTIQPGDLFFAIRGPAHDGHDHLDEVFAKGAIAAVVERRSASQGLQLEVPDTLTALQSLARHARATWTGTMIGVTGSAGKTTTKDVIAHLLSAQIPTGKTDGNFNNHVGAPLSLLRLPDECQAAVLEVGMNHAGEIAALAEIVKPSIGVVTNVGTAHIENFESIDGIAAAKRELIEALPSDGLAVLNADDPRVRQFGHGFAGRVTTFGLSPDANIRAESISYSESGVQFEVPDMGLFETPLVGRTGVLNVLAGISVAREFGVSAGRMREAAKTLPRAKMRGQQYVRNDIRIIDDCYNSNPEAAKAMLDLLRDTPASRRIAVLGEMLELGRWAESLHRDVGRYAVEAGVHVLVGIRGAASFLVESAREAGLAGDAAYFFDEPAEAGRFLRTIARPGDSILFKGSRGAKVELALQSFLQ